MRKEIIIRMQPDSDKGRNKALKVAASVSGVESVTVTGRGKDLLLVIGDAIDAGKLTRKLKEEVGEAEILELRTLPGGTSDALPWGASSKDTVVTLSPNQRHPTPSHTTSTTRRRRRRLRLRLRLRGGQQLVRARGGAQPPGELLPDDRAARLGPLGGEGREHGRGEPN
ncbi:hypothetical protein PVAP13_7NG243000 [Panicum virgatum]|uniref:Uncharacterized protein n=1 Tax=Panicum virgatum TaxID=38727 RepID=A0A8T0PYT1_PANVG|nr:hypothetical protein PVAP13_7NG243000 [Panicum virgatum]